MVTTVNMIMMNVAQIPVSLMVALVLMESTPSHVNAQMVLQALYASQILMTVRTIVREITAKVVRTWSRTISVCVIQATLDRTARWTLMSVPVTRACMELTVLILLTITSAAVHMDTQENSVKA